MRIFDQTKAHLAKLKISDKFAESEDISPAYQYPISLNDTLGSRASVVRFFSLKGLTY